MCVKSIAKIQSVINTGLCNRCGSCVGLSNGSIQFEDKEGVYSPVIKNYVDDRLADRIWNACSGKEVNFPAIRNYFYDNSNKFNNNLGSYRNLYVGYCNNSDLRKRTSSGGILTSILLYLLKTKKIDGAVVLGMSTKKPWMNRPYIATTAEGVIAAAGSKYTISSVNEILNIISSFNGKLAYVGLPGQVQSIRKLQMVNDSSVRNIKYIFGPFYGNILHFSSVISFLKSHRVNNYKEIEELDFRYGEWPGKMKIKLKNNRIIELDKFYANYLIPFHILKQSLLCTDLTNEFTDLSGGDAWAPIYEERGKGFSLVVSRTEDSEDILLQMQKEKIITLKPICKDDAISMHSHAYDLKKRGAFIRIKIRRFFRKEVPDYGYILKGFSITRYIMEIFIYFSFTIFGTKFTRNIIEKLHPRLVGKIFRILRILWKKSTYKVKKSIKK